MAFKKIKLLKLTKDLEIVATFDDDVTKTFDARLLFEKNPVFKQLENVDLFTSGKIGPNGHAIVWNDELDLAAESVYYDGK